LCPTLYCAFFFAADPVGQNQARLKCVTKDRNWQIAALKLVVVVMNETDDGSAKEPDWMNPANDRKTPYTEEEINAFIDDFILGLEDQEWLSMKSEYGEKKAKEIIRAAIVKMDERNLVNLIPKGSVN
jgi:hypothetical protein